MVLEETLESPLDSKKIQPVDPKGNQHWIFIGRTDAEAETPIFWPRDMKNWLIERDPDAGKEWGQEEKGVTENQMVGWHLWLNGHKFEQALGDGEGQGSLTCCSSWSHKGSDMTEQPNNSRKITCVFANQINKEITTFWPAYVRDRMLGSWCFVFSHYWSMHLSTKYVKPFIGTVLILFWFVLMYWRNTPSAKYFKNPWKENHQYRSWIH